jgi:hypothetical protein
MVVEVKENSQKEEVEVRKEERDRDRGTPLRGLLALI